MPNNLARSLRRWIQQEVFFDLTSRDEQSVIDTFKRFIDHASSTEELALLNQLVFDNDLITDELIPHFVHQSHKLSSSAFLHFVDSIKNHYDQNYVALIVAYTTMYDVVYKLIKWDADFLHQIIKYPGMDILVLRDSQFSQHIVQLALKTQGLFEVWDRIDRFPYEYQEQTLHDIPRIIQHTKDKEVAINALLLAYTKGQFVSPIVCRNLFRDVYNDPDIGKLLEGKPSFGLCVQALIYKLKIITWESLETIRQNAEFATGI